MWWSNTKFVAIEALASIPTWLAIVFHKIQLEIQSGNQPVENQVTMFEIRYQLTSLTTHCQSNLYLFFFIPYLFNFSDKYLLLKMFRSTHEKQWNVWWIYMILNSTITIWEKKWYVCELANFPHLRKFFHAHNHIFFPKKTRYVIWFSLLAEILFKKCNL